MKKPKKNKLDPLNMKGLMTSSSESMETVDSKLRGDGRKNFNYPPDLKTA